MNEKKRNVVPANKWDTQIIATPINPTDAAAILAREKAYHIAMNQKHIESLQKIFNGSVAPWTIKVDFIADLVDRLQPNEREFKKALLKGMQAYLRHDPDVRFTPASIGRLVNNLGGIIHNTRVEGLSI